LRHNVPLTLGKLEQTVLTNYAPIVAVMLDDADDDIRHLAIVTLSKLEPAIIAQYTDAVTQMHKDPCRRYRMRVSDDIQYN